MRNFFQKQREIITIFAYLGIVVVLVYFVILSLLSKIEGVNNEIQEESLKQVIVKQQLAELPKIQKQYDALEKNEGLIDVLLDKDKAVVLIEKLEKLAQDSSDNIEISIQNSQLQTSATAGSNKTTVDDILINALPSTDYLQMQISLTGDYNKIVNFISRLENMEYYSDIIEIKIKQSDIASDTGVINPFNPSNTTDTKEISNAGDLKATLDVVFYTKK